MMWLLYFTAWIIVGCGLLSSLDDDEGSLLAWCKRCPVPGGFSLIIILWPISYTLFRYCLYMADTHTKQEPEQ